MSEPTKQPDEVVMRALVFLGSFLLFLEQPIAGRMLLPSAGGGSHVWTAALMFFQGALLIGYLYCHWMAPRLGRWHVLVAAVPIISLPLAVTVDLDPASPVASILGALIVHIGPTFLVLSTTSVLAQTWLARKHRGDQDTPYSLYATSNAGALIALLLYPVAIEPLTTVTVQSWLWSGCYLAYLLLLWRCCPRAGTEETTTRQPAAQKDQLSTTTWPRIVAWMVLAAAPSALLLSVTNILAQDIGSAPFVWVVPLALYFSSFVLVFRKRPIMPPPLRRFWPEIAATGLVLFFLENGPLSWSMVFVHCVVLFTLSMAAHSIMYRSRPEAPKLTGFYVAIAAGGWAGAAFVTLAAPRLFLSYLEYPLAVVTVVIAASALEWRSLLALVRKESRILLLGSLAFIVFLGSELVRRTPRDVLAETGHGIYTVEVLETRRNAYGTLRVTRRVESDVRTLLHGTTTHGEQWMQPENRRQPGGYYARESPLGDVLSVLDRPRTAAIVGLGAGVMAAHFGAGEKVVFYELDADVADLAQKHFTYLEDTAAEVRIVIGDGRVQLAREEPDSTRYDAIIIDAFSSDAIPTHLLTTEAVQIYLNHLNPNGYVVFHISSRSHDLRPVLRAAAQAVGAHGAFKDRMNDLGPLEESSTYFVIAAQSELLTPLVGRGWTRADDTSDLPAWRPWTDDYVNLWQSFSTIR